MKRAVALTFVGFLLSWAIFPAVAARAAQAEAPAEATSEDSPYEQMQVLARAMQLIRQDYVEEKKVSFRDLTYAALRGMLSELDPHSSFMDPRDFKGMQEDTKSEFGGLGVTVHSKGGSLTIVSLLEDSPAFEAGLMPGDQILKINGTTTERLTVNEAVDMLRGDVGEKVTLTIGRASVKEVKEYTVARKVIKVPTIKDVLILPTDRTGGRKIGYIRLTVFSEPTATELAKALDKLEKEGMEALILDLRFNPGGLLSSAVDVCSQFLAPNTRVVYTEGRSPTREYFTSSVSGGVRKYPLAILINSASASGSEIVAGALKDLKRAILVGETTFGKGSVQSVVTLPDGSAMRFTTAKYYTPGQQPIHEHGVSPDIRVTLTLDQELRLWEARRRREFPGMTEGEPEEKQAMVDPQMDRAIDALTGVLLYTSREPAPKIPPKKG